MELRHLRYFIAVAEELHFGLAARRLHTAQSSLSKQIRDLEGEVGAQLLRRSKRQVQLTDAGRVFLTEARLVLRQADHAVRLAQRAGRGDSGRLAIGFVPSADCSSFPAVLKAFKTAHPAVAIGLRPLSAVEQVRALKQGEIDVGFFRPPGDDPMIASEVIARDPLVAALPHGHSLLAARKMAVKELAKEPLLLCGRQQARVQHGAVMAMFRGAQVTPNVLLETDHIQTILALVAAGMGASVLPASVMNLHAPGLEYRPLEDSREVLEMSVAYRREDDSPVLAEFLAVVREVARRDFLTPPAAEARGD